MKTTRFLAFGAVVALGAASTAFAGSAFNFTAPGGLIDDNDVTIFPLGIPAQAGIDQILSINLTIAGLTHSHPEDLEFYLAAPNLSTIKILQDQGDGLDLNNVTVTFADSGINPPGQQEPILGGSTYKPKGLVEGSDQGFASFVNKSGTGQWLLLVNDDSVGDTGSFGSLSLRGTFVPEPATLTLLILGAAAALRRRIA